MSRFRPFAFISILCAAVGAVACANDVEDNAPIGSGADDADAESALAQADVRSYVVHHQQDTTTWEMADVGENSTPYAGVAWPGGTQGNIAEAGKPLKFVYERYESSYYVPPSRCYDEIGGYYYDCPESYGYTQYVQFKDIELQYRFDGGPIQTASIKGSDYVQPEGTVTIPADVTGTMEYWFKLTRTDGNTDWDSRNGGNYFINIMSAPTATLVFDSAWQTSQTGDIKQGKSLRINYDIARLRKEIRKALNVPENVGPVDFYIGAHVSFDGKPAIEVPCDFGGIAAFLPLVEVPADARNVDVWFRGWGRFGYPNGTAEVFDSNYGANYHFTVKR